MTALSASELQSMQSAQERSMDSVGTIIRMSTVPGILGPEESWSNAGTVACRVNPVQDRSLRERVTGAQLQSINEWTISFPAGTNVTVQDKVGVNGLILELESVNGNAAWQTEIMFDADSDTEFQFVVIVGTPDYMYHFGLAKNSFYLGGL